MFLQRTLSAKDVDASLGAIAERCHFGRTQFTPRDDNGDRGADRQAGVQQQRLKLDDSWTVLKSAINTYYGSGEVHKVSKKAKNRPQEIEGEIKVESRYCNYTSHICYWLAHFFALCVWRHFFSCCFYIWIVGWLTGCVVYVSSSKRVIFVFAELRSGLGLNPPLNLLRLMLSSYVIQDGFEFFSPIAN